MKHRRKNKIENEESRETDQQTMIQEGNRTDEEEHQQSDECSEKAGPDSLEEGSEKPKPQADKKDKDQEIKNRLKMEKMEQGRKRARIIAFAAVLVAAAAILIAVGIYRADYSKVITVISTVGDVTFTNKFRDEDGCYVTFVAADYNRIPEAWQESGVRIKIDSGMYDILVLDIEYDTANIVFEVPQGIARKAGFSQEDMNVQSLWTDEILQQYTSVRNIIWSTEY